MGADGRVGAEVLGEDLLGGRDVGREDGVLGVGVCQALDLGGADGRLEQGDGVEEVDGRGPALLEVVEAGVDVGEGLFGGGGRWLTASGEAPDLKSC